MVPGKANQRVIADRLDWVQRMTDEIRALPRSKAWLYAICTREIADLLAVRDAYLSWLKRHLQCVDTAL